MGKYIDAEELIAEIKQHIHDPKQIEDWRYRIKAEEDNALLERIVNIITSLQQKQPEVDLEKFTEKIKTFQTRYKYPEIVSIKGAMAFMARMFYQYPNVARQWYEQLPKATID